MNQQRPWALPVATVAGVGGLGVSAAVVHTPALLFVAASTLTTVFTTLMWNHDKRRHEQFLLAQQAAEISFQLEAERLQSG